MHCASFVLLLAFSADKPVADKPPITGQRVAELEAFDDLVVEFLETHKVPGASLAITKDGRLVYARGFGYADAEAKEPVKPTSLFRIASISKPFTVAAVLQLVEQGKLKMDDKIFPILNLEPLLEDGAKLDPRWKEITVEQVLRHKGGWDRDASGDPMFMPIKIAKAFKADPPANQVQIIRYMMGKPLDHDPGKKEVYSNFGYCILGRVIERVSGETFEDYVRKNILKPLGIKTMRLGRTLENQRAPGEVKYYDSREGKAVLGPNFGKKVPTPYGAWNLEAMDSHGGWISSAVDVARFASALDEPKRFPALGGERIQNWFARDYKHKGALDGTSTLMDRPKLDGVTWTIFFNSRYGEAQEKDRKNLVDLIEPELAKTARAIKKWPDGDLFKK
jgi:N-acyl-D-amino-acid deacylase